MRSVYIFSLALLMISACKSKQTDDSIAFTVQYTEEYCGGTEPTEEMIEELETPKPYTGRLYLHLDNDPFRKEAGVEISVVNGKGVLQGIPTGCYLGFTASKELPNLEDLPPEIMECYKESRNVPEFSWTIYEDTKTLEALVTKRCDPCGIPMP